MKRIIFAILGSAVLAACSAAPAENVPVIDGEDVPLGSAPDQATYEASRARPTAAETQKDCIGRFDHAATITVHGGNYGNWAGCFDMCPAGSYAYGINMKSEAPRGDGDDTSVNALSLWCYNRATGNFTDFVESTQSIWGSWLDTTWCNGGMSNPIVSGNLRLEAPQGSGDDTSANGIKVACRNAPATELTALANTGWGTYRGQVSCPAGTAVCGIKTRVEANQGSGDDTALNGVQFACCTF